MSVIHNFILNSNSQLLDLLLDVNESNRIPLNLRYDLRSPPPDASAVPALIPDQPPSRANDANSARAALQEAMVDLANGQITPRTYREFEVQLLHTMNKPSKTLGELGETPHTTLTSVTPHDLPSDLDEDTPAGYLSPTHEQEFLSNMDNYIENAPPDSQPIVYTKTSRATEKEKDKEAQLRNPVSVYNWLRKHYPSVFLQDEPNLEKTSPRHVVKASPKPARDSRSTKRSSAALKLEQEIIDDEGYVIGGSLEVPPRNKRKREDEPYRPKGGASRSTKKKKVSGGAVMKKSLGEDEGG